MVKLLFADHLGLDAMSRMVEHRRSEAGARRVTAQAVAPGRHWPGDVARAPAEVLAPWLVRSHTFALAEAELSWCDTAESTITHHRQQYPPITDPAGEKRYS